MRIGTDEQSAIQSYDSSSPVWEHTCGSQEINAITGTWEGLARINSIVFPAYPNAPKDNQNYGMLSAFADIYVVKIPDDLKKEIETKDIAVYGSPSNVPDDRKKQDLKEILTDATRIPTMCLIYDSEKDITIDGREAHLSEADSRGVIAIQLDEDTIGVIDVFVYNTAGRDEQLYSGRAWDFIDSLDISKS